MLKYYSKLCQYNFFAWKTFIFFQISVLTLQLIKKLVMKSKKKNLGWNQDVSFDQIKQDRILLTLIDRKGKNWAQISKQLQKTYGYKKTGRQCRERWYNHLDPNISKLQWTQEQQDVLFEEHQKYGSKWSQIGEKLQGRSDNSIKNHFYSTMRKILRRINKFVGIKNGTAKVRDIKPLTLSKLFFTSQSNEQFNSIAFSPQLINFRQKAYKLINFSRQKLSENKAILNSAQIQNFSTLLAEVTKINNFYQSLKQAQTKMKRQRRLQKCFDKVAESSFDEDEDYSRNSNNKQLNQKQSRLCKVQQGQCGEFNQNIKIEQHENTLVKIQNNFSVKIQNQARDSALNARLNNNQSVKIENNLKKQEDVANFFNMSEKLFLGACFNNAFNSNFSQIVGLGKQMSNKLNFQQNVSHPQPKKQKTQQTHVQRPNSRQLGNVMGLTDGRMLESMPFMGYNNLHPYINIFYPLLPKYFK